MRLATALVACVLAAGLWIATPPGRAAEASPNAEDPALDAQAQRVAEGLRCLVCQNQTIADSNAELAHDLRREVRQMLKQGKSEAEVREFMVARYGDFILYRPPFKLTTYALWIGPFVLLAGALLVLGRTVSAKRRATAPDDLSSQEKGRLDTLLNRTKGAERG
jgi:cytochrome c-type biogenesis protein CcmH